MHLKLRVAQLALPQQVAAPAAVLLWQLVAAQVAHAPHLHIAQQPAALLGLRGLDKFSAQAKLLQVSLNWSRQPCLVNCSPNNNHAKNPALYLRLRHLMKRRAQLDRFA
jgi:hypothetical protein